MPISIQPPSADELRKKLESLSSKDNLRSLFVEQLNYKPRNNRLNTSIVLSDKMGSFVEEFRVIAGFKEFDIILCVLDRLLKTNQREIHKQISQSYYHSLVVFTNPNYDEYHFANLKHLEQAKSAEQKDIPDRIRPFRRMVIGPSRNLRTASERLTRIFVEDSDTGLTLSNKCNEAFDVSAVTEKFYEDFVTDYNEFSKNVKKVNGVERSVADEFTQNLFNRLLFLYFVQKKGFLNRNKSYLYDHFIKLKQDRSYYKDFLVPLFEELSGVSNDTDLGDIPFLNGGLFEYQREEKDFEVTNQWFEAIFENLLERYNFTVRENTEFEQEIAIDPEMLGTIFERLILNLEAKNFKNVPDPRRQSGSYYTPKFVVGYMVKQSLAEYLKDKTSLSHQMVKKVVFDGEFEVLSEEEAGEIKTALRSVNAVDPGVGSGAFPVGLLLKIVELIEGLDKEFNHTIVEGEDYRYQLKKQVIENNIYGVDIQERAVHLAELRLWLSLLVDVDSTVPNQVPPLPNLDFHILRGNSLVSKIGDLIDFNIEKKVQINSTGRELLKRFQQLKIKYDNTQDIQGKDDLRLQIEEAKESILEWFLKERRRGLTGSMESLGNVDPGTSERQNQDELGKKVEKIDESLENVDDIIDTFNWGIDFAEIMLQNGGFDIVIGNPPYGIKENASTKNDFSLGSKDSFGIFTSLGLEIARPDGVLCYIMSDTWQTIRTHKDLRNQLLKKTDAKYLISVPSETFKATVNPGVYLFRKRPEEEYEVGGDNVILAADLSPLSIEKGQLEVAFELLAEEKVKDHAGNENGTTIWSDKNMAIFAYPQGIIPLFSNHSFFIASPKLYRLMQDVGNKKINKGKNHQKNLFDTDEERQLSLLDDNTPTYQVEFNGKVLNMVKIDDIDDVAQGLATGDNPYYLRQSQEKIAGASRNYDKVDFDLVLKDGQLEQIVQNEALRASIIQCGIVKNLDESIYDDLIVEFSENSANVYERVDNGGKSLLGTIKLPKDKELEGSVVISPSDRYFNGRYFVPYDKGGSSDIEAGWLPNYYVPTDYYIDWCEGAIKRMRNLTIADRIRKYNEDKEIKAHYENTTCAVFRNTKYYFTQGITGSRVGKYSPSYRETSKGPFSSGCSNLYSDVSHHFMLSILCSRFFRYLFKCFVNQTVNSQVDDTKPIPIRIFQKQELESLATDIIRKQKKNQEYDYLNKEQVEIDRVVYDMYNLNQEDTKEVNRWFWRRYPKLARAIERNNDQD